MSISTKLLNLSLKMSLDFLSPYIDRGDDKGSRATYLLLHGGCFPRCNNNFKFFCPELRPPAFHFKAVKMPRNWSSVQETQRKIGQEATESTVSLGILLKIILTNYIVDKM